MTIMAFVLWMVVALLMGLTGYRAGRIQEHCKYLEQWNQADKAIDCLAAFRDGAAGKPSLAETPDAEEVYAMGCKVRDCIEKANKYEALQGRL
jgi:hypothetical protein